MKFRIPDLMQVAAHIVAQIREHKPDAVFLDATGIGYGVYDRLQQLNCQNVTAVNFGAKPDRLGEFTDAQPSMRTSAPRCGAFSRLVPLRQSAR